MDYAEMAKALAKVSMGPSATILEMILSKVTTSSQYSTNDTIEQLIEKSKRAELEMAIEQSKAHVAQEMAIASRISTAEEVEIEEHYEYTGEGNLGLKGDGNGFTFGASGAGKKVTRRICRFKGGVVSNINGLPGEITVNETIVIESEGLNTKTDQ